MRLHEQSFTVVSSMKQKNILREKAEKSAGTNPPVIPEEEAPMSLPDVASPPFFVRLYWSLWGEEWRVDSLHPTGKQFPDYPRPYLHLDHWLDYELVAASVGVAVLLGVLRLSLSHLLIRPFARLAVKEKEEVNFVRFTESVVKILYYGTSWALSLYTLWGKPYFWDLSRLMDTEKMFSLAVVPDDLLLVYRVQLGWYIQSLVTHYTLDTQKADDLVMVFHHVLTIVLMFTSIKVGYIEYGLLVLFSMDICDVFLEFVRALRLCASSSDVIETLVFLPLPISWVLFRIVFYWKRILAHSLLYVPTMVGWAHSHLYYPFNAMLLILLAMNLYWFFLIMRIAYQKVVLGKTLEDTREKKSRKVKRN